jgi:hypothetical protein
VNKEMVQRLEAIEKYKLFREVGISHIGAKNCVKKLGLKYCHLQKKRHSPFIIENTYEYS